MENSQFETVKIDAIDTLTKNRDNFIFEKAIIYTDKDIYETKLHNVTN
jgi:hypothetical protein